MSRLKGIIVLVIDIVAFYAALALMLRLRYGEDSFGFAAENHLLPFSLLFILWFLVFYISDLYNIRELK
ncbi:hypothetical protein HY504_02420, partial [Candidatus Wolfebacteria bacterium]|nr:hypothetical protein [Candidatus Wolfebacteria bacterium]